jgi:hypothetical protein
MVEQNGSSTLLLKAIKPGGPKDTKVPTYVSDNNSSIMYVLDVVFYTFFALKFPICISITHFGSIIWKITVSQWEWMSMML